MPSLFFCGISCTDPCYIEYVNESYSCRPKYRNWSSEYGTEPDYIEVAIYWFAVGSHASSLLDVGNDELGSLAFHFADMALISDAKVYFTICSLSNGIFLYSGFQFAIIMVIYEKLAILAL